jgi:FAD:protein FMN transferase
MILQNINIKKGSFICLFFVLIFSGCDQSNDAAIEHKIAGNALGTTYHITYLGDEIANLSQRIDSILVTFNYGLSTYDSTSFISQYNRNVPLFKSELKPGFEHFMAMHEKSILINKATDGAFDPRAAELFSTYDAFKKQHRLMDTFFTEIAKRFKGFEEIEFDEDGILMHNRFKSLNFNAIAKGYFVDLLSEFIESQGSKFYMVEVGGEVRCNGVNANSNPWNIGINRPAIDASPTDFFEIIPLSYLSMATSGNYKNYYEVDGKIIGHTLDPRSGEPVISDLKSASIMHKECAVADAYATACMVLGLEKSKELIKSDSSLTAFFIYEVNDQLVGLYVD